MIKFMRILILAIGLFVTNQSMAWEPSEVLSDPVLELRARKISAQLRCLVCQNQSIDDSDADLAKDLRLLVRERLSAGDTDEAIFSYLVARYGSFILLKPKFGASTLLLWGLPIILLLAGGFLLLRFARKRTLPNVNNVLSAAEKVRLAQIVDRQ